MLSCIILWIFLPKTYISAIEDSLIKVYKSTKIDTIKFDIADRLYTIKVRQIKFIEAKAYIDTLQVLAHKINQEQCYSSAFTLKANYYYKSYHFDSAIVYKNKSIEIASKINYYTALIKCTISLANIHDHKADFGGFLGFFKPILKSKIYCYYQ